MAMRKLKKYKPTRFMAKTSTYSKEMADYAVMFIESLTHTKGTWAGKPFELIDWQEQIIRDLFGVLKPNGYRQFNTAYIEIPKKMGKSELAAAVDNCSRSSTILPLCVLVHVGKAAGAAKLELDRRAVDVAAR